MKVSLKWLSEYVNVPADIKAFCDRLDLTGTGVEDVEEIGAAFDNIVTAKVLSKEHHPDSDHMWVCSVDVGACNVDEEGNPAPLEIVCGAQNFEAGDHIVTAMIGAELPGGVKIKKSKLRGVVSNGMNCSKRELGLGDDHDGIMILPADAPVGMPLAEYLGLSDTVLDLEITPNRPDCLSMVGMAREVGAMYGEEVVYPLDMAAAMSIDADSAPIEESVSVTVDDPVRCPRYTARVIRNVKVGPSPEWLVERLSAIGQRSINNVVDITNYILFLFGQPLHAFDLNSLMDADGKADIVIRAAREGEKLTTLDGVERELTSDMTVIATPEKGAVALAGVMGGLDTEVTETTTDILLEAATFEAGRTSRTSRNLGLVSESSMRYERIVDDHGIDVRSAAACALMEELAGGTVSRADGNGEGIIDVWPSVSEQARLRFRIPRFNAMMGAEVPLDDIVDILERLGCETLRESDETLAVTAPTFRPDLEREIDLYEEVLRLWGMDRIPSTLPAGRGRYGVRSHGQAVLDVINDTLRACGMNETMTYSFSDAKTAELLRMDPETLGLPVELLNPLNAEHAIMRQTVIAGLLQSVAYNQAHGVKNIQLYEIGTVFSASVGRKKPKERTKLAGVLAGAMNDAGWNRDSVPFDFFDGKGVLECLARELALPKVRFKELSAEDAPFLQPGRAAQMMCAGSVVGWVGELHPLAVAAYEAQPPVVAFELDVATLIKNARDARPYAEISPYPPVEIDQAFIVSEDVSHESMAQVMRSAGGRILENVELFDIYRDDERVGTGKKSMAYRLTYRLPDRTLVGDEVEKAHANLVKKVCGATGAEVRG